MEIRKEEESNLEEIKPSSYSFPLFVREPKSDSDKCDSKEAGACEKPVNENGLTIGLAVGIPVFVVLVILGLLLIKSYRRNKKEMMENDPDFDETGEVTALPDFPKQMDNPFDNRNSVRYPYPGKQNDFATSNVSLTHTVQAEPYLDKFILPYQHQIGSKASLDEYAKQIGEMGDYRHSYMPSYFERTRNSSVSNGASFGNKSVSPQKSQLKVAASNYSSRLPTPLQEYEKDPVMLNNNSTDHLGKMKEEEKYSAVIENQTYKLDSESNSNSDSLDVHEDEKYAVKYENESDTALNSTSNLIKKNFSTDTFTKDVSKSTEEDPDFAKETSYENSLEDSKEEHESPFGGKITDHEPDIASSESESSFHDTSAHVLDEMITDVAPGINNEAVPAIEINSNAKEAENESEGNKKEPSITKSPRISAFNLLSNDSDEEIDEEFLDPKQEEEVRRMRSVYKVYFDRANSVRNGTAENGKGFEADLTQPLPDTLDHLKINKDLKSDTAYDKRKTRASSIYTETPIFTEDEAKYHHQQEMLAEGMYAEQQQAHFMPNEPMQHPYYQNSVPHVELPPLQQLPTPSEIRKSTIQTYTDYEPRIKNHNGQGKKQPFNPIEDHSIWSSPVSSPGTQVSPVFNSQQSVISHGTNMGKHTVPSATQFSRSSVVMLNPVTEITKQRKFVPAGSLPSIPSGHGLHYSNNHNQEFESDLIPGSRKSQVRKMMNTNF